MTQRFPAYLWLLPLTILVTGLVLFPRWTVDDAFISYRYASHWAETGQWAWNPGGPPVEGFTGYFLPISAAIFLKLGVPPEEGIRWMTCLFSILALVVFVEILRKVGVSDWIAFFATALFSVQPWFYVHAHSGLETNGFILFELLAVWAMLSMHPQKLVTIPHGLWLMASLILTFVRPEGILFLLVGHCLIVFRSRRNWLQWVLAALPSLLIVGGFQVWRYSYFGQWLPQSVVAKSYDGLVNVDSLAEMARFMGYYLLVPGLLAVLVFLMEYGKSHDATPQTVPQKRGKILLAMVAAFVIPSVLVYARSHLYMNFAGRILSPMFPLLLLALTWVFQEGWAEVTRLKSNNIIRWKLINKIVLILVIVQFSILAYKWRSELLWVNRYARIMNHIYKPLADDLAHTQPPDARLACYMDAGAIPYYSKLYAVDFGRLNEPDLSKFQQGSPEAVDYFFTSNPDVAVFTSFSASKYVYTDEADAIQADPRFNRYKHIKTYSAPGVDDYFQWVFVKDNAQIL